ncbi:uncharacterized protein LTR77_004885 [Saxophila tyrrhenica]|uniref:NACHT domain-containing protein n=1 Tax=Saxophila tyrrhenica TaxID=1690608 RepID=A0AAV9PEH5_9PEZI|nr:hypothetical protein LTR77_004885 [Saxophila tyrrhenica]
MAELGIAGSAVGVASLGIMVCQGLLSYYEDWKASSDDIKTAHGKIRDLEATLELLAGVLRSDSLEHVHLMRIEECLIGCYDSMKVLQKRLQKLLTNHDPKGFRQVIKAGQQRLLYPFKKDTLDKLNAAVDDLVHRLSLALHVLHLNVDLEIRGEVREAAARLKAIESSTIHVESIVDQTHSLTLQSSSGIQKLIVSRHSDELCRLRSWLSAPDAYTNHREARRRHEPGTGEWFLHSSDYQQWLSGDVKMLSLVGKAGACKTVLCSTIVEDLLQRRDALTTAVAFFYFTFSDQNKQSYRNMLLGIIHQLADHEPVFATLQETQKQSYGQPATELLEKCFNGLAARVQRLVLVSDALDEVPHTNRSREEVLGGLGDLVQKVPNLSILTTSRPEIDILEALEESSARVKHLNTQYIDQDIKIYVAKELERNKTLRKLSASTKQEIRDKLGEKADGMFRWAYCQLDELSRLKRVTAKNVTTVLENLPKTLDETYERILLGIDPMDQDVALAALRWLTFAEYPLTLRELEEACITSHLQDPYLDEGDRAESGSIAHILAALVTDYKLTSDCDDVHEVDRTSNTESESPSAGSIASTDAHANESQRSSRASLSSSSRHILRLAHFSIKEYLVGERISTGRAARYALCHVNPQRHLAQDCIAYLYHYYDHRNRQSKETDEIAFPLLEYAVECWTHHQRAAESAPTLDWKDGLEISLLEATTLRRIWIPVTMRYSRGPSSDRTGPASKCPLHLACYLGLRRTAESLIRKGFNVNEEVNFDDVGLFVAEGASPLSIACESRETEIVQLLLASGADCASTQGTEALRLGIEQGSEPIVRMALQRGANANAIVQDTPVLLTASMLGCNIAITKMLLDHRADPNLEDCRGEQPLMAAAGCRDPETLQLLLTYGADPNCIDRTGRTALVHASDNMMSLLEHGANPTAKYGGDHTPGSAIRSACREGGPESVEMARILLDHGADPNLKVRWTEFNRAAFYGRVDICQLLLLEGATIQALEGPYISPLHVAILSRQHDVAEVLIKYGADLNDEILGSGSPLQHAARYGDVDGVKLLLLHRADPTIVGAVDPHYLYAQETATIPDSPDHDALHVAMQELESWGDFSPLGLAQFQGHQEIICLLEDALKGPADQLPGAEKELSRAARSMAGAACPQPGIPDDTNAC